jgi:tetratricopeptide (TPR) repeat protein
VPVRAGLGLVLLIALLAHSSYVLNGFTWLDHGDIENGRAVLELGELPGAFVTRFGDTGFYRPLVTVLHSVDAALFGGWAPGYHVTNVALHLAACAAAFLLAGTFFGLASGEGLLVALVVGIHPLSWLPVGAISYRPELLATLFTFLAVSLYIRSRESGSRRLGLLAIASFALGVCSKETVLPWVLALVAAWEVMHRARRKADNGEVRPRPPFWLLLSSVLVVGLYVVLRSMAVPEVWRVSPTGLPLSQAVGTRLAVLGQALARLVDPRLPGLSDATPVRSLASAPALAVALGLIGGLAVLGRVGLRSPWARVLVFLAIALTPALNIVPLARFSSPHYAYFGIAGVGAALAVAFRHIGHGPHSLRRSTMAALAVWMLTMAGSTFAGGFRFRDDVTLFTPEVERDPHFLEGHQYLGDHFFFNGDYGSARLAYEAALERQPGILAYVDAHAVMVNLAGVHLAGDRPDEADELLRAVTDNARPDELPQILYNRALIAFRRGDFPAAAELLGDAATGWTRPEPLLLLAEASRRAGRQAEAVAALRRVLPLLSEDQRRQVEDQIRQLLR